MSRKVKKFRDVVDRALDGNVRRIESGPSRPISILNYRHVACVAGLTYVSLDRSGARPSYFGMNEEHMWGVGTDEIRLFHRQAYMAVVSIEGVDDSLLRRISVQGGLQQTTDTVLRLDTDEQLEDALSWAESPQLSYDAFCRLAMLQPAEEAVIESGLERLDESARQLHADLEAIDRAQQQAWNEAWDYNIG